jgi:hypothetical protein
MSETIAASSSPKSHLALDKTEKKKQSVLMATKGSSSFEKIVSACTGAVITMSFSRLIVFRSWRSISLTILLVNPLDVVKTRLQENATNGLKAYTGTIVGDAWLV